MPILVIALGICRCKRSIDAVVRVRWNSVMCGCRAQGAPQGNAGAAAAAGLGAGTHRPQVRAPHGGGHPGRAPRAAGASPARHLPAARVAAAAGDRAAAGRPLPYHARCPAPHRPAGHRPPCAFLLQLPCFSNMGHAHECISLVCVMCPATSDCPPGSTFPQATRRVLWPVVSR